MKLSNIALKPGNLHNVMCMLRVSGLHIWQKRQCFQGQRLFWAVILAVAIITGQMQMFSSVAMLSGCVSNVWQTERGACVGGHGAPRAGQGAVHILLLAGQ